MSNNDKDNIISKTPLLSEESKRINKTDRKKYIEERTKENIGSIKSKMINYNSIEDVIKIALSFT